MIVHRLERRQRVDHPVDEVFAFFAEAHNLERITPTWLRFELVRAAPVEMQVGALIDYRLHLHGLPIRWTSRIEDWEPARGFVDRQVRGPYRLWHHRHTFTPDGDGTVVGDEVHYALPLGRLGDLAHSLFVRRDVERIFAYRHAAVPRLLAQASPGDAASAVPAVPAASAAGVASAGPAVSASSAAPAGAPGRGGGCR